MPVLSNPRHERQMTLSQFKELLEYDATTGNFYWRCDRYRVAKGSLAGQRHPCGYWMIGVARKRYLAHRLAWLFVHGEWPQGVLDHRNGDKLDNRIENLREATVSQNASNGAKRSTNTSGYKGVSRMTSKGKDKWRACIVKDGKQFFLGSFDSPETAHQAYVAAANSLHGEFARPI